MFHARASLLFVFLTIALAQESVENPNDDFNSQTHTKYSINTPKIGKSSAYPICIRGVTENFTHKKWIKLSITL